MPAHRTPRTPPPDESPEDVEDQPLGFWVGLRFSPGMPPRDELLLQRRLEDRLLDLGLRIGGGTQRYLFIEPIDRELSLTDQVDLVDWCLGHMQPVQIAVSTFTCVRTLLPVAVKVMRIGRFDPACIAVSWLYRMGRIGAEQYVEILGGFVPALGGELLA